MMCFLLDTADGSGYARGVILWMVLFGFESSVVMALGLKRLQD